MKIRGLSVAIVVLAALSGFLYWSNRHKPSETTEASANIPPKVLTLNEGDITKVEIRKKGASELTLVRDELGKWKLTASQPLGADQSAVSSVLSTLSSLSSERLVEDKATNLGRYGLAEPALEADVTEKNNKTHKLLIGDDTPTSGGAYAALAGDPRVFTIASYSKSSIDKTANDLRDKRLLPAEPDKVSRVELRAKNETIEFGRDKDQWQILKPKPLRADSYQVDELVRKLTDAKMDFSSSAEDNKKAVSAFASGTQVASAQMTDNSGAKQLQVRKNKDDYYAKSSAVEGIYKVTGDLGSALDKKLNDFRNKKLFDFGYSDPSKIEMHDGAKTYFLNKGGNDWWGAAGNKMDADRVQSFLDRIRDLAASKFADSGFAAPVVTVTVTSNDGKRIEKVLIAKQGDSYIAKRENEPGLYEIDAKAVEDLRKSAGDLKPVPSSKK